MEEPWFAVSVVVFVWWFLTGSILFLVRWTDNKGSKTQNLVAFATVPIAVLGVYGFFSTLDDISVKGVYFAFFSSLLIWSWFEITFLTGILTGPNTMVCSLEVKGYTRFKLALTAVAYSEVALFITFVILFFISAGEENLFGFLTFLVLYVARLSAKINLFLGVPKINTDFLPDSIAYMRSHFRIGETNRFFPFSVFALLCLNFVWVSNLLRESNESYNAVGFSLLCILTLLAVLEHIFMIWRVRDALLWQWAIPKKSNQSKDSK